MSVVSTRHTVVPFIAGTSKPFDGQRLAKIGFKKTAKIQNPLPSVCVSVPHIQPAMITENVTRLLPYIGTMLENAQDGIIRSLYESSEGQRKEVSDDEIGINAVIAFLESEAQGDRLTKDRIVSWFDTALADSLAVLIAEKLGFNDPNDAQTETINKHVRVYRDCLSMLAGGKTFLAVPQIRGCKTALSLLAEDDDVSAKLAARIAQMEAKPVEDMLEL